jgi:four helix bundle protein
MPNDMVSRRLGAQLFDAGTSVGANLHEADMANSVKDFVSKVNISQKEAGESAYWLGLIQDSGILVSPDTSRLAKEACELRSICRQIVNASNRKTGKTES